MDTRGDAKATPGDPLRISAFEWNRHVDAATKVLGQVDTTKKNKGAPDGRLRVYNEGSEDIWAFEPAIITGVAFEHDETSAATYSNGFNEGWVVKVKDPSEITDTEWKEKYNWHGFVITQEPVDEGAYGLALASGITPFLISSSSGSDLSDETHLRWKNNLDTLEADSYGVARILYMRTDAATGWGLIQFPVTECRLWTGTLTEDIGATTDDEASCTLKHNDGSEAITGVTVQAQDTLAIFTSLNSGADVMLIQSGSEFRIIQAGC